MPRYAIRPVRVLTTQYIDAGDALEAVNVARRALIEAAKYGELEIARLRDHPEVYDQERDYQLDFDPDDETEHRWALRDRVSASEADPWP